jgi:hypothetical protein
MRELLHCLLDAVREVIWPAPFDDLDPAVDSGRHSCPDRIHPGQST